ncbi:hypothetical protein [Nostoc sp. KVJ20]|uniref:hypothetical protein n=1 Tax=Nostoc sp. KVJ20 TaxID=457944 RepID=UPI000A001D10|nr:hypothetical protein [Nostoc sp. KVJ20]
MEFKDSFTSIKDSLMEFKDSFTSIKGALRFRATPRLRSLYRLRTTNATGDCFMAYIEDS